MGGIQFGGGVPFDSREHRPILVFTDEGRAVDGGILAELVDDVPTDTTRSRRSRGFVGDGRGDEYRITGRRPWLCVQHIVDGVAFGTEVEVRH